MCTVATRWAEGEPVQVLGIRDELVSRDFDDPGRWWPDLPSAVGGRDRQAGGTWCVSDIATGATAIVVNRRERRTGTPSRGVLPLAAARAGRDWPGTLDVRAMASFTLVLADPAGVTAWVWDAAELARLDLAPGTHVVTTTGVDADDAKGALYGARFAAERWLDVVTSSPPQDDLTALVVRHPFDTDTYATVFGQLITARPGELSLTYSRTPWQTGTWTERSFR